MTLHQVADSCAEIALYQLSFSGWFIAFSSALEIWLNDPRFALTGHRDRPGADGVDRVPGG